MTRKRRPVGIMNPEARHRPLDLDWEITTDWTWNGRKVTPGVELKIKGERGRFRFIRHVRRPSGVEWVDAIGGPVGQEAFRSFRPERIVTVHRTTTTRANAAA